MDGRIHRETNRKSAKRRGQASGRRQGRQKARARVVIADNDPIILNQIVSLLEAHFEVVGRVASGRELVRAVEKFVPSVAVADVAMPEMNGIEAARMITKKWPQVKVVVLSAHTDPALVEAAFEAGASGYVSKFTAYRELIPAIEDVLVGLLYRSSGLT